MDVQYFTSKALGANTAGVTVPRAGLESGVEEALPEGTQFKTHRHRSSKAVEMALRIRKKLYRS